MRLGKALATGVAEERIPVREGHREGIQEGTQELQSPPEHEQSEGAAAEEAPARR
ncbi:hypothetical protein GCM10010365_62870 [Streptomyces poonensis]|uniref:Uncharacterized protein n=1 Tax=Streptomyces poonensis TaxID=68255 RepID=A0A918Q6J0_9ACTN|nr:hypothetical protein GCM10010365_62870 [Streptomyces poonensis]GLJ89170.1 hypothetical protein GCM10017589_17700 [Streptomyces poonensis]